MERCLCQSDPLCPRVINLVDYLAFSDYQHSLKPELMRLINGCIRKKNPQAALYKCLLWTHVSVCIYELWKSVKKFVLNHPAFVGFLESL